MECVQSIREEEPVSEGGGEMKEGEREKTLKTWFALQQSKVSNLMGSSPPGSPFFVAFQVSS